MKNLLSGVVAGLVLGTLCGCGSSSLVQCRIDAVKTLPLDEQLSIADIEHVVDLVKECKIPKDAGP